MSVKNFRKGSKTRRIVTSICLIDLITSRTTEYQSRGKAKLHLFQENVEV